MQELLKLSYSYIGIDLSPEMLQYSQRKADKLGYQVELHKQKYGQLWPGAAGRFRLYYVGLSLCEKHRGADLSHFSAVSKALNPGGLYFLDWCVDFGWIADSDDYWTARRNGITIDVRHSSRLINCIEQTFQENIELVVDDHGILHRIKQTSTRRAIYPQEFLLISQHHGFESSGGGMIGISIHH